MGKPGRYVIAATSLLLSFLTEGNAQTDTTGASYYRVLDINPRLQKIQDSVYLVSGICKPLKRTGYEKYTGAGAATATPRFLKIKGTVNYDYLYRSFADTPYYQKDFRQHTIQTNLNVLVDNRYPLRLNLRLRFSNSPSFKNFFDGGFVFDRAAYERLYKERLLAAIQSKLQSKELEVLQSQLKEKVQKYEALQTKLQSDDVAQQLIEARERAYFNTLDSARPSLPGADAPDFTSLVAGKQKELDSLGSLIRDLESKADSIRQSVAAQLKLARNQIQKAKQLTDLRQIAAEHGVADSSRTGIQRLLSSVKRIGIGRSFVNYSELTVANVALTGIHAELNPKAYYAVAAGKIDYGFRDFLGRQQRGNHAQQLLMGRIGWGNIDKRAIILSVYTGRKVNYGALATDTVQQLIRMTGLSVEGILRRNNDNWISAEIAQSTQPITGRYPDNKALRGLLRTQDATNLGVAVKGAAMLRSTKTKLSGLFRKTGKDFQSFSLFSYNTDQVAWSLKAEQSFFRDRLDIIASLRRNDFVNPFTERTFKTTTVFKSIQATLHVPKWPTVSIGYYPGTQLYIIDRDRIRENAYYMFNASVVHQYRAGATNFLSSLLYNHYATQGTDSGFINYNGKNYLLSQSFMWSRLQWHSSYNYTDQQELQFYTIESGLDYNPGERLQLAGSVRYNQLIDGSVYWGGRAQVTIGLGLPGQLQLQYDKSFLPTIRRDLFPVEIGRLSWFKTF